MVHYNLRWSDERLIELIARVRSKHGKVTPTLISQEGGGAYDHLWRRVKKGQFQNVAEAIEKLSKVNPPVLSPEVKYVRRAGGRRPKWTEEEITRYLVTSFLERGKVTANSNGSVYAALYRRVKKGEFESTTEAIERLWFRGLVVANSVIIDRNCLLWWAAKWLVDTVNNGNAKSIKRFSRLIVWEEGKVREVLKVIFQPCYPAAQNIVRTFAASKRGKKLRILISTMDLN